MKSSCRHSIYDNDSFFVSCIYYLFVSYVYLFYIWSFLQFSFEFLVICFLVHSFTYRILHSNSLYGARREEPK